MNLRVDHLLHAPLTQSVNKIKDQTVNWLSRSVNWIQSTMQQNQAVAVAALVALNTLVFLGNVILADKLLSDKLSENEEMMAKSYLLYLHTIQVFAFTRIFDISLSPLAKVGISVATVVTIIFRPDQWIYSKLVEE